MSGDEDLDTATLLAGAAAAAAVLPRARGGGERVFLLDYTLPDGRVFSVDLPAPNLAEAGRALAAIVATGRIVGELVERGDLAGSGLTSAAVGRA